MFFATNVIPFRVQKSQDFLLSYFPIVAIHNSNDCISEQNTISSLSECLGDSLPLVACSCSFLFLISVVRCSSQVRFWSNHIPKNFTISTLGSSVSPSFIHVSTFFFLLKIMCTDLPTFRVNLLALNQSSRLLRSFSIHHIRYLRFLCPL